MVKDVGHNYVQLIMSQSRSNNQIVGNQNTSLRMAGTWKNFKDN